MFHHRINKDTPLIVVFHWMLLSFLAGSVNSGGFIACGRFVSHVTGFFTLFGQHAAHLTWRPAFGLLSIPFYFMMGVMISAYLVERPIHSRKKPRYVLVMGLIFLCLMLAAGLGHYGFFGRFGETKLKSDYLLLVLLCLASGLQNGAVSIASGHTVRLTHMTGNTTDLGIGIVRTWSLAKTSSAYSDEVRSVRLRAGILVAFVAGSAIGAYGFLQFKFGGFLIPAAIAFYIMIWEGFLNSRLLGSPTTSLVFIPRFLRKSDNRL